LADGDGEIKELLEQREREYMLGRARVKIKSSVENVEAGDYSIASLTQGESAELPRWVAEELVSLGIAEASEESFEIEIFRALSKEKMMGPFQLSVLTEDFYPRMRRRVENLRAASREGKVRREEFDKLRAVCYDLVGMRLSKLLSLSSSSTRASDLGEKLTPEERSFFSNAQTMSHAWKTVLLGQTE